VSFLLVVIVGIGLGFLLWAIFVFNSLVRKRNRVNNAWSDINVQLKRRYDLIPNLVEVVKGYKEYEVLVLENIVKARAKAMSEENVAPKAQAEEVLSNSLRNLFAVAENYPQLKSSENFQKLQTQLSSLENDIQSARIYYNAAVRELNNSIQVFPPSIIAKIFNFKKFEFFGVEKNVKDTIQVSF